MRRMAVTAAVAAAILITAGAVSMTRADDLTGSNLLLCTAVQATGCHDDGECDSDLPWNLNVPQFIEVDLRGKRLSTTQASGLNRATTILHLQREGGRIGPQIR